MNTRITHEERQLEMAEDNSAWRPVHNNEYSRHGLGAAVILTQQGNIEHALNEAEEAWVARHGHMHDVAFRVRITTETYVSRGNYERCMKTPWEMRRLDDDPLPTQPPSIEQMRDALNIQRNPNVNPPAPPGEKPPFPPAPPLPYHSPF
jgi:hypothetical protein